MSIDVTTDGEQTSVTLTYSGPSSLVNEILLNAAQRWHHFGFPATDEEGHPLPWSETTLTQKKGIINRAIRAHFIDAARENHIESAEQDARVTAGQETSAYDQMN